MRHILRVGLFGLLLMLGGAVAHAQEIGSEISGGGGGSSSVGPGTAGAIPKFASTTTLGDSKLVASGTNGGTMTLYDDTAVTGVSGLYVREGAGQSSTSPLGVVDVTNSTFLFRVISTADGRGIAAPRLISTIDTFSLSGAGLAVPGNGVVKWNVNATDILGAYDLGLARASAGVVKVTDGSSGYGAIDTGTARIGGQVNLTSNSSNAVTFQGVAAGNTTLELREAGGGSANFKYADSSGNATFYLSTSGATNDFNLLNGSAVLVAKLKGDGSGLLLGSGSDVGVARSAAGVLKVTDGSSGSGSLDVGISIQGWQTKTLTESSDTGFVDIALAQNTVIGGYVEYVVRTTDGTDYTSESGQVYFTGASKTSGTVNDTDVGLVGTPVQSTTAANTFTNVFTSLAGTNKITLRCKSDSTLTGPDTITLFYRVHLNGAQTETITGL